MKNIFKFILILASLLCLAHPAEATVYHVSPTGNDLNDGLSLATAWHTIQWACHVVQAGDSTYVHGNSPGVLATYLNRRSAPYGERSTSTISNSSDRFQPCLATINQGTSTQPIVFRVWPGDSVAIKYDPIETGTGPLIGSYQKNYIEWNGFVIIETSANYQPDTGPVVMTGGDPLSNPILRGCKIKNCDIRSIFIAFADNHNSIRTEWTTGCEISNSKIRGVSADATVFNVRNYTGIMTYNTDSLLIEHNEINNAGCGIALKGGGTAQIVCDHVIIRYNLIYDCCFGIDDHFAINTKVYQNIIRDGRLSNGESYAIFYSETCFGTTFDAGSCPASPSSPPASPKNGDVYNNVIYGWWKAFDLEGLPDRYTGPGNDLRNNIVMNISNLNTHDGGFCLGIEHMENEYTSNYNDFFSLQSWRSCPTTYSTFTTWKSGSNKDLNSIVSDPLFVNAGTRDFHLQNGSPCIGAAPDFGDLNNNGNTTELINIGVYQTGNEIIGIIPTTTAIVSPTTSYFVPEAGTTLSPITGTAALAFAVTCPNNDLLNNNARIKIVLKTASGTPLSGVAATDIYASLNGGPASQGFSGTGDDTLMASSVWQPLAGCPNTRHINADAATDVTGTTYITWKGSTPGQPGVATRDRNRKWGLFAGDIPIFALGVQLQGRLTTASANGTFTANVKNVDVFDPETTNQGEIVNILDFNVINAAIQGGYQYQYDFNGDGLLNVSDLNILKQHMNHKCNFPNAN